MSELANKIKAIRGTLSAEEAGVKCELSRESFYRMERGGSVRFETIRQIAAGFQLDEKNWLDLLVAWLNHAAGEDAHKLWIEKRDQNPSTLHDTEASVMARATMLFKDLNPNDREQILKAMQRPEVRGCLPAINRVWDKFEADAKLRGTVNSSKVDAAFAAGSREIQAAPGASE